MDAKLSQRFEIFLIENSLKVDQINYMTHVQYTELGDGKLVIFDGSSFKADSVNFTKFWDKIFHFFRFRHIVLDVPEGIEYYWRTRSSLMHKLPIFSL